MSASRITVSAECPQHQLHLEWNHSHEDDIASNTYKKEMVFILEERLCTLTS
jgi:hypothetical protein